MDDDELYGDWPPVYAPDGLTDAQLAELYGAGGYVADSPWSVTTAPLSPEARRIGVAALGAQVGMLAGVVVLGPAISVGALAGLAVVGVVLALELAPLLEDVAARLLWLIDLAAVPLAAILGLNPNTARALVAVALALLAIRWWRSR